VNPSTHTVFTVSPRGDTVTIIDGATNQVVANVRVPNGRYAIAVDAADNQIFANGIGGDHLTRIDGHTLTATPVVPLPPQ